MFTAGPVLIRTEGAGFRGIEQGPGILERPVLARFQLALAPLQIGKQHFRGPGRGLGQLHLLALDGLQLLLAGLDRLLELAELALGKAGAGLEGVLAEPGHGGIRVAGQFLAGAGRRRQAGLRTASSWRWMRSVSRSSAARSGARLASVGTALEIGRHILDRLHGLRPERLLDRPRAGEASRRGASSGRRPVRRPA